MTKQLFLILQFAMFTSFAINASTPCDCTDDVCTEQEEEVCIKYRMPPSYENSVIRVPIEREPVQQRPSNYESSFYEQMTR